LGREPDVRSRGTHHFSGPDGMKVVQLPVQIGEIGLAVPAVPGNKTKQNKTKQNKKKTGQEEEEDEMINSVKPSFVDMRTRKKQKVGTKPK
jgi:hypothetical protein